MKPWSLYMIQCRDKSLYTGITTDVKRRFKEHASGKGAKFLRGKGPLKLVFTKRIGSRGEALRVEYRVKKLTRVCKKEIIVGKIKIRDIVKCKNKGENHA